MERVELLHPSSHVPSHETSAWHLTAEIESEVTTLAAICQVKHQQRAPLETSEDGEVDYAESSDDDEMDGDEEPSTSIAASLTVEGTQSVKMRFLDRLAEILCYKKEAHYVTCAAMQVTVDKVNILAVRNATWEEKDIKLLAEIAVQLELVAKRGMLGIFIDEYQPVPSKSDLQSISEFLNTESITGLQAMLSEYYTPRLNYHASKLLALIKKKKEMRILIACLKAFLSGEIASTTLVEIIDDLCYSTNFYSGINQLFTAKQAKRLNRELGFLCRPRYACTTFWEAAREIEGFHCIKFTLVPGAKAKRVPPSISLRTQSLTKANQKNLDVVLRKKKWIHAEMGMVTHLISKNSVAQTFPYLGISKKTCFMCGHILQSLGLFRARNNHGKVYSQWTLPSSLIVPSLHQEKLDLAVQNLHDVLRHECAVDDDQHIDAVNESTISTPVAPRAATWSPFNRHIPDPRIQARQAEWLSTCNSRAMAGRAKQSHTNFPDISHVPERDETQPPELNGPQSCAQCRTTTDPLTPCTECDAALYCSKKCRTLHWLQHKYTCRLGRPLDEADDFILACQREEFPTDEPVTKAFGFRYFASAYDRQRLFQIYCQLVNSFKVTEDELREAWRSNKLKEFLLFRGSQIPSPTLQREIRWLHQQDGFASGAVLDMGESFKSLLHLVESGDRKIPLHQWEPREKIEAYTFFYQMLNGFVPDAEEDNWIFLGFCTARDYDGITMLADLYKVLIGKCKFQEFWKAMEQSDMVGLFDKYGLGHGIAKLRNFGTLMKDVGTWYQSVWELKRFTRLPTAEPMQAAALDYGFCNCQTPLERMALRGMYAEFFARGGDEMGLHQACINGELASFLLSESQKFHVSAELLSNPYPLYRCGHMGMVVENAILCSESNYELVKKSHEEMGEKGVILTHPDEQDEGISEDIKERSQFLGGLVRIRKTEVQGVNLKEMAMMS
ncbi:uncharacterized protein N7503_007183 [Penicillium pulvis]|uniref:uncharacterized protein n=1 Tax=Penicillium pulvis TaxID=1562058 RepID=UPI00254659A7|nr:uncharacterized protein N7503_007183 [Penicillium pulvis]KAJ5797887.1 hypothetical protein N7503_007183 [Penicillium pulvis]